jgi:hypothetical protein
MHLHTIMYLIICLLILAFGAWCYKQLNRKPDNAQDWPPVKPSPQSQKSLDPREAFYIPASKANYFYYWLSIERPDQKFFNDQQLQQLWNEFINNSPIAK